MEEGEAVIGAEKGNVFLLVEPLNCMIKLPEVILVVSSYDAQQAVPDNLEQERIKPNRHYSGIPGDLGILPQ